MSMTALHRPKKDLRAALFEYIAALLFIDYDGRAYPMSPPHQKLHDKPEAHPRPKIYSLFVLLP
jgi:hypothetical protein